MSPRHPESHVLDELDAFVSGALDTASSARVGEHLLSCRECRAEADAVSRGQSLVAELPLPPLPSDAWPRLERALAARAPALVARRRRVWRVALLAAGLAVLALLGLTRQALREGRPLEILAGAPRLDGRSLWSAGTTRLAVGRWLETPDGARARISFGPLGHVDVEPGSRVRIVASSPMEQRLDLRHGSLSAIVIAPPRLFIVDTPAVRAVDLGCAYRISVDKHGEGSLSVTSGRVALMREGREIVVPAGASCAIFPWGAGVPVFDDAAPPLRAAVDQALAGDVTLLPGSLPRARVRDGLTLVHLIERVEGETRRQVRDRLAELVPPPGDAFDAALLPDTRALDAWRRAVDGAR